MDTTEDRRARGKVTAEKAWSTMDVSKANRKKAEQLIIQKNAVVEIQETEKTYVIMITKTDTPCPTADLLKDKANLLLAKSPRKPATITKFSNGTVVVVANK